MSLCGVVRWKLSHYCYYRCIHQWMLSKHSRSSSICLRNTHIGVVHQMPLFLIRCPGHRLLSVSTVKLNIFSKLTSFLERKVVTKEDNGSANEVNVYPEEQKKISPAHNQDNTSNVPPTKSLSIAKFASLLDKLPSSSPYKRPPLNTSIQKSPSESKALEKAAQVHKEILTISDKFLNQYSKDLDKILDKASASPVVKRVTIKPIPRKTSSKKNARTKAISQEKPTVKYPMSSSGKTSPMVTEQFDRSQQMLQSLGIPCEELAEYPDVQNMSREDLLCCLERLKEQDIHVVFSLYLIRHAFQDIKHKESVLKLKQELKQKTKSLSGFKEVQLYKELCQLLDKPDLDIRHVLEEMADIGIQDDMATLHKKVKMLRSVGATADDILCNLEILRGKTVCLRKIQLYKSSQLRSKGPFPVDLFRVKDVNKFKEQLAVSEEAKEIADLLEVSLPEFQTCWGYRHINSRTLLYKIQKCLAAGISKRDIFNNLSVLERVSVENCHTVTRNLRTLGMTASIFVLKDLADVDMNGMMRKNNNHNNNSVVETNSDDNISNRNTNNSNTNNSNTDNSNTNTSNISVNDAAALEKMCSTPTEPSDGQGEHGEDWTGAVNLAPDQDNSVAKKSVTVSNSARRHQHELFLSIRYQLGMDRSKSGFISECGVNVEMVSVMDVAKNLDYLQSCGFTKAQLQKCPLVLAHPHHKLENVVRNCGKFIIELLNSSSSSSLSSSSVSSSSSPSFSNLSSELSNTTGTSASTSSLPCALLLKSTAPALPLPANDSISAEERKRNIAIKKVLLDDPLCFLNTVQYILERDNSFSMASVESGNSVNALNVW